MGSPNSDVAPAIHWYRTTQTAEVGISGTGPACVCVTLHHVQGSLPHLRIGPAHISLLLRHILQASPESVTSHHTAAMRWVRKYFTILQKPSRHCDSSESPRERTRTRTTHLQEEGEVLAAAMLQVVIGFEVFVGVAHAEWEGLLGKLHRRKTGREETT